jgi:hypothetical protein
MPKCALLFKDGSVGVTDVRSDMLDGPLTMVKVLEKDLDDEGTPYKVWNAKEAINFETVYFHPTKVYATVSVVHTVFIEA